MARLAASPARPARAGRRPARPGWPGPESCSPCRACRHGAPPPCGRDQRGRHPPGGVVGPVDEAHHRAERRRHRGAHEVQARHGGLVVLADHRCAGHRPMPAPQVLVEEGQPGHIRPVAGGRDDVVRVQLLAVPAGAGQAERDPVGRALRPAQLAVAEDRGSRPPPAGAASSRRPGRARCGPGRCGSASGRCRYSSRVPRVEPGAPARPKAGLGLRGAAAAAGPGPAAPRSIPAAPCASRSGHRCPARAAARRSPARTARRPAPRPACRGRPTGPRAGGCACNIGGQADQLTASRAKCSMPAAMTTRRARAAPRWPGSARSSPARR